MSAPWWWVDLVCAVVGCVPPVGDAALMFLHTCPRCRRVSFTDVKPTAKAEVVE